MFRSKLPAHQAHHSDFVALLTVGLLSVALLSRIFNPSVEAKCTLRVAVCRFSGVLLILALKRRFRVVFWFVQYQINLHSRANS